MSENNLNLGIQYFRKGDKETAIRLLSNYVLENPKSEEGWLWLGHSLTDITRRKYCYNRVLQLNSTNQEALKHLNLLERKSNIDQSNISLNPVSQENTDKRVKSKVDNPAQTQNNKIYLLVGGIGFLVLLICSSIALLFFLSPLNKPLIQQSVTITNTPTLLDTYTPTFTQTPSVTPTITATIDLSALANPLIAQAESLISQENYEEAVSVLDQAIGYNPNSDKAYYLRATSYYNLTFNQNVFSIYQENLDNGLSDIDQAIAIQPQIGDYYMLRQDLLIRLVGITNYRIDRFQINRFAAENALAALNLGTSHEGADRIYLIDLIYGGRCEEALELSKKMIEETSPQDTTITGLYHIQSNAYICLGEIDQAIFMVNKSMVNPSGTDHKKNLQATYLYQAGEYEKALEIINELLLERPNFGGERYYLRAAIYYALGEIELAEQDLYIGSGNTWFHGGVYSYISGKLALDNGFTEEGIKLLQHAEATLEVLYNPLRKEILAELEELDAIPLEITPSVMIDSTSIPTIIPRPTSSIKVSTPIPGLNYPSGIGNAFVFDPSTGTGEIFLKGGDYPMFILQPSEKVSFESVKKITFNIVSFTEILQPTIQIYMYNPYSNGWRMITPNWGENEELSPENLVYPTGDMIFAIRNYGTDTVKIDNLTVKIILETENGELIEIGPE